jgi:hypothetical protein
MSQEAKAELVRQQKMVAIRLARIRTPKKVNQLTLLNLPPRLIDLALPDIINVGFSRAIYYEVSKKPLTFAESEDSLSNIILEASYAEIVRAR